MHKLINISEASSIAIHSLALIAKLDKHINATHIAKLTGFSKNHLSKILQILVKQGYLSSNRGPKGGFNLIRDPQEISLLEVYELIEGKSANDFCTEHNPICPFMDCIYGDIVEEISIIFHKKFSERTIADINWKNGVNNLSMLDKMI
jgi:Rrf2 family protein